METHPLLLAAVPVAGFIAGFINTLAGSGSLLTLPMLILLGLPANVANATNRVGVLLQTIAAVATFRHRGALPLGGSWKLLVPSIVGGVVGAELAVDLDEALLRQTIGVLMLVLIVLMFLKPERWIAAHATPREPRLLVEVPLFFAIGIYGGFIQVSVGLFLLAGLVLGAGYNLVGANGAEKPDRAGADRRCADRVRHQRPSRMDLRLAARRGPSSSGRGWLRTSPSNGARSSFAGSSS